MNSKKDFSKSFQFLNTIFETNHVVFEPINPSSLSDAQLILDLRSRESNNFLRKSSGDINSQIQYLKTYHKRNKLNYEIYYKLKDKTREEFNGVVRITELNNVNFFNWESLVFSEDCSPMAPIDVMISVYKIGFELLKRSQCGPWDVDKRHKKMMKIHDFCNMYSILSEDENYYHVAVLKKKYLSQISRFEKLGLGNIKWI